MATTTTMDPARRADSYAGIYWSIAIAVLVILAFTWAMRPTKTSTTSDVTGTTMSSSTMDKNLGTTTGTGTLMENNTSMDSTTPANTGTPGSLNNQNMNGAGTSNPTTPSTNQ